MACYRPAALVLSLRVQYLDWHLVAASPVTPRKAARWAHSQLLVARLRQRLFFLWELPIHSEDTLEVLNPDLKLRLPAHHVHLNLSFCHSLLQRLRSTLRLLQPSSDADEVLFVLLGALTSSNLPILCKSTKSGANLFIYSQLLQ